MCNEAPPQTDKCDCCPSVRTFVTRSAAACAAAAKPWLHGRFDTIVHIQAVQARLALLERKVPLRILRAYVLGARADEPVVGVLLQHVRGPAGDAADGENR